MCMTIMLTMFNIPTYAYVGVGDASINHGHAGILYAYAPYYRAFIEHRGYKTGLTMMEIK